MGLKKIHWIEIMSDKMLIRERLVNLKRAIESTQNTQRDKDKNK